MNKFSWKETFKVLLACSIGSVTISAQADERMLEIHSHRLFEDTLSNTRISADGKWALKTSIDGRQVLYSLPSGEPSEHRLNGGLEGFEKAALCGRGILRLATSRGQRTWLLQEEHAVISRPLSIPVESSPTCSPDGQQLAYVLPSAPTDLWVGDLQRQSRVPLGLSINRMTFSNNARTVFALGFQADNGLSTLFSVTVQALQSKTLVRDLDTSRYPGNTFAVAPDDDAVFIPLVGTAKPDDAERQIPEADRWLKLYRFDLKSRELKLVRSGKEEDQDDPVVIGNDLYWVGNRTPKSVAVAPMTGGRVRQILGDADGYLPAWSLDGKRLTYVAGSYRRADLPMNQDVNIVDMDVHARVVSKPKPFIVGPNEDFPPAWSPDGRFIAFHSHRSPQPLPYAEAPGATDDYWLREAENMRAPEVQLTHGLRDSGWVYWAPDGRSVIYSSQVTDATHHVFTSQIDPATGRALTQQQMQLSPNIIDAIAVEYAPSGDRFAVQDMHSPMEGVLWLVNRDGTHANKLLTYRNDTPTGLSWLPDGSGIAYAALDGDKYQIFMISTSGGAPVRITDGEANYMHPRVSPDGRWVAFSRMETVLTVRRMHLH